MSHSYCGPEVLRTWTAQFLTQQQHIMRPTPCPRGYMTPHTRTYSSIHNTLAVKHKLRVNRLYTLSLNTTESLRGGGGKSSSGQTDKAIIQATFKPAECFILHAFACCTNDVWLAIYSNCAIYSLLVEYNTQVVRPTSVVDYLSWCSGIPLMQRRALDTHM